MNTPGGPDRLYASLNPLVMDGTLTPQQADRVYSAVGRDQAGVPGGTTVAEAGWDRPRLFAALTVLAAGLIGTAYLVAAMVDEEKGAGAKSTILLLGTAIFVGAAAAVWYFLLKEHAWSTWVSGTLGAIALAGLTFSILVLGSDDGWLFYLTGLLMLAGGVAGFWFLKGQLYTVVAVVGGILLLGQFFSDIIDGPDEGDALTIGIGFLLYGLVVAGAGWMFSCRRLLAMIGLFIGGFAMFVVMIVNSFALVLSAFAETSGGSDPFAQGASVDSVRSDIRVALLLGLLVVAAAALVHAYDGFVGFAVLAFAGALILPVVGMTAWHTEHPIRWSAAFAVVGGLGIAALIGLQFDRRRPSQSYGYAGGPMEPGPGGRHQDTISR
jgi:hypothetical protein